MRFGTNRSIAAPEIARGWAVDVATVSSDVIGFLALHDDKLEQLFIAPSAQGKGVGKALLDFAKREKPDGFWLTTSVENSGSNRFYAREGMIHTRMEPHPRFPENIVRIYEWKP